jgi:putative transposase
MGRTRYRIYETEYPYFITSSIVRGYPVFSNILAANIILDSLTFLQNHRDTTLYAYDRSVRQTVKTFEIL